MRLITRELKIDFLGMRHFSFAVSGITALIALGAYFAMGGFHYGIDFSGGTLVQVRLAPENKIEDLRTAVTSLNIGAFSLQAFGEASHNEYLITLPQSESERKTSESIGGQMEAGLKKTFPSLTVQRIETVGPKVGAELKVEAAQAVGFALLALLIYIWFRFEWRYGVGAIVATGHDVLFVLGAFILTQKEISLPVVAGVLTVAGYSVNDTIVVFDRIRERMRRDKKIDAQTVFNQSVNQTLSRTLLTSGTTLLTVLAMYLFGGDIIHDFSFALLVGIVVGTYSSIFVAAPIVLILNNAFPPKKA
ncbi:MAG: protein translocase subunit SecF [Deltaproteobacteria bacterium]|nr:protein translocase subunit SecF [Deltaproteobacteria bacterium]